MYGLPQNIQRQCCVVGTFLNRVMQGTHSLKKYGCMYICANRPELDSAIFGWKKINLVDLNPLFFSYFFFISAKLYFFESS